MSTQNRTTLHAIAALLSGSEIRFGRLEWRGIEVAFVDGYRLVLAPIYDGNSIAISGQTTHGSAEAIAAKIVERVERRGPGLARCKVEDADMPAVLRPELAEVA